MGAHLVPLGSFHDGQKNIKAATENISGGGARILRLPESKYFFKDVT
jgi:hypothetical protein